MRVGRTIARYTAGAVAVALVISVGVVLRIVQFAQPETPGAADAIVVLGAAQYNGRPSPVFQARLDHAIELYRAGVAAHVVTIGGGQIGDATTEGEAGSRYLAKAGVPESALQAVPMGGDTLISLRAAADLLRAKGWDSVVLVTDPWHMARSRMMARDLGLSVRTSPVTTGPALDPAIRTRYVLRELVGIVFYRLIGGSSGSGSAVL